MLSSKPPLSKVSVYRQDAAVSEVSQEQLPVESIGRELLSDRVGIVTGRGEFKARADREGNYIYSPSNKRFNQVQAFVSAQRTTELFSSYAERDIDWAFEGSHLAVIPHAGEGKNAYYARWNQSIAFYSFDSRPLKKTVHTAQSADVVSHETGHALLDGMRPQWGKTFDKETKAMHEAVGDCAAMLLTISRPENRRDALAETGGDLTKDNCISRISEEFGEAVRRANRNPNDDFNYLRNANNQFRYQPPGTLPNDAPRDVLSAESHSFCQIFTRGFYNSVVAVYDQYRGQGMEPEEALGRAGDVMGRCLAKGLTMSAPNKARFADVAQAMLRADQLAGGQHKGALLAGFQSAGILSPDASEELNQPLPQGTPAQVLQKLGLPDYTLARSVTDSTGRTTHEFLLTEEVSVEDAGGWGPLALDVTAGLSLSYDGAGQLVHLAHLGKDVDKELNGLPSPNQLSNTEFPLNFRVLPGLDGSKLEALPVFVD